MNLRSGKVIGAKPVGIKTETEHDKYDLRVCNQILAEAAGIHWGSPWIEQCPLCPGKRIMSCKCNASDSVCPNGHAWHFHYYHEEENHVKVFFEDGRTQFKCPHNQRKTNGCHCVE